MPENTTENAEPQGDEVTHDNPIDEGPASNAHPEETQETVENESEETAENTFPREYVEKLRAENAENRVKAKKADDYAQRLHTALTAATGRLADPSDLPFEESHLEDPEALETAITDLLTKKPHLATRRPTGDIGLGVHGDSPDTTNLAGLLRANAS